MENEILCSECFFLEYDASCDEYLCCCDGSSYGYIRNDAHFCDLWLSRLRVYSKMDEFIKLYSFVDNKIIKQYAVRIISESLYWSNDLQTVVSRELSQDFVDKINRELAEENEKGKQLKISSLKQEIKNCNDKIIKLQEELIKLQS